MSVEEDLDLIDQMIREFDTEQWKDPEAMENALNTAADCLAFCKSLFDTFQLNGMLDKDASFDPSHMENLIDALVGELSAAVLYLKGQPPGREVIDKLHAISIDIHQHNSLAKEEDRVPHTIKAGFSRLADRIESTKLDPT